MPIPIEEFEAAERAKAQAAHEMEELRAENQRLRERLQIDPGGSDKVDELEQALQFARNDIEQLRKAKDKAEKALAVLRPGLGAIVQAARNLALATPDRVLRGVLQRTVKTAERMLKETA